jgi:hypothetical protein
MTRGTKNWRGLILVVACLVAGSQTAFPRHITPAEMPVPMKRPPSDTNAARWHSIKVTPRAELPKIHFYDKLNPVWWVENSDEPVPPEWYKPADQHRVMKWHFRNPFHNFDNYVIGVADKKFVRSGKYPERNSSPHGGWDFEVARRKMVLLPFISYQRSGFNFYFGWRERGNFGIKLNYSRPPDKKTPTKDSQAKPAPWQSDKNLLS